MTNDRAVSWSTDDGSEGRSPRASRSETAWRQDAHAVIIGIDRYLDPSIPDLQCARRDAEAVYRVLTDPGVGRFHPDNVTLLVDADATERRIRSALGKELPQRVSGQSTVCIYYAGHGAPGIDVDARRGSADNLEKYLVPHDAVADDLRSTAISMELVQQFFSWLDANQVFCFLDSCYSGAAGGRSFERDSFQTRGAILSNEFIDALASDGRVVITACAANEVSLEHVERGHGLFTYHLVEGLKGAADSDQDGRVSLDELYGYVYERVERDARRMNGRMRPIRKGSVRGRVYLTEYRERYGGDESAGDGESSPAALGPPPVARGARRWLALVAVAAVVLAALAAYLFDRSRPAAPGHITPAVAVQTGFVLLDWKGALPTEFSVVDRAGTVVQRGIVAPHSSSRLEVPVGEYSVVMKGVPGEPSLRVTLTSGGTTGIVAPAVGQLRATWTGPSQVTASIVDLSGRTLVPAWPLSPNRASEIDLPVGAYEVRVPAAAPAAVSVAVGRVVPLTLAPRTRGDRPASPIPPVVTAPYVTGQWGLPATELIGFAYVPEGPFRMGSDLNQDRNALQDEGPPQQLSLAAFYVARHEVTVDQYKACVDDSGCHPVNSGALTGSVTLPVRYVSWAEALEYCRWLDRKLRSWTGAPGPLAAALQKGWEVRLPTEAEWEKAARGTDGRTYPWGEGIDSSRANYDGAKVGAPSSVGRFRSGASPYGAFDMSGNVWEWTSSRYVRYPYRAHDGREDPKTGKNVTRVIRGGSFQTADVRAARRNSGSETERTYFTGFRTVIAGAP